MTDISTLIRPFMDQAQLTDTDEAVTKFSPGKVHDKLSDHYPDKVLDWVKQAAWSDPTEIKLKHIDMARRPGGRDMKKVRGMAKAIRAGKKMDPIYLVDTPSAPPMAIADGYHRALAHQHAGKQTIMAHVASVDEEHGPWDRAMHDAKLNKVGPKGYVHGWIFVGPQAVGGRVFNSEHGHGRVASHGDSHVDVHFDNGHKESYRARFKEGKTPRLYGPAKSDAEMRAQAKPDIPPMTEMKHPEPAHDLKLVGMRAMAPDGQRAGLVFPRKDGNGFEVEHDGRGAYGQFETEQDALAEIARGWEDKKRFLERLKEEQEQHQYAREVEDKHIFAPRRGHAATLTPAARRQAGEVKADKIEARRRRIMDMYGAGLRIHDDPQGDPAVRKHLKEFFSIPESHHRVIAKRGYRIDIGRGTVADYHPELADVRPGGYTEGTTWKDSAGAHNSGAKDIQPWLVFGNTVGHGSHAMVPHELGHAMDYSLNPHNLTMTYPMSGNDGIEPWGAGFRPYFNGLNEYDTQRYQKWEKGRAEYEKALDKWRRVREAGPDGSWIPEVPQPTTPLTPPIRLLPYYRDSAHGGHDSGSKEMFAEAYSAYVTSPKAKRTEAITRTLHGGVFDGDDHVGRILVDYFDDMTEWLEANR